METKKVQTKVHMEILTYMKFNHMYSGKRKENRKFLLIKTAIKSEPQEPKEIISYHLYF